MAGLVIVSGPNFSGRTKFIQEATYYQDPFAVPNGPRMATRPPGIRCAYVGVEGAATYSGIARTVGSELAIHGRLAGERASQKQSPILLWFSERRLLDRNPFRLSGGEQAMLALGTACAIEPNVLAVDNTLEQLHHLARHFLAIAAETKCLNEKGFEQLHGIWRRLYEERPSEGLTDKNLAFLRNVLTPGVWGRVVKLPFAMMEEARRLRHAPVRAAVIAQKAVAIAILSVAPVRLANLTAIRLGTNLMKPDGPNSNYWLHFAPEDTKNTVRLQFVFKEYLTRLIDEYVKNFWPTLLRGRKEDYLFPGLREGAKGKISFSVQITKHIYKATGLKMTVHQFRHSAGAIILKNRPGEFELVRQILGHRSITTTMRCYVGLETIQASEIFTNMVVAEINQDLMTTEEDHDSVR